MFSKRTLPKLCQTTGFLWTVFSRITTESTILSLYGKIRKIETRILSYFLQWDKHLFRKTPLELVLENLEMFCITFLPFTIFLEAVPQRNSRSSLPDVFFWWLCYLQNFTHFSYYCLLPSRQKDVVTTLLRLRYPTSLWRCYIVAMEMSGDVAKPTSLQRLIKRRHN